MAAYVKHSCDVTVSLSSLMMFVTSSNQLAVRRRGIGAVQRAAQWFMLKRSHFNRLVFDSSDKQKQLEANRTTHNSKHANLIQMCHL